MGLLDQLLVRLFEPWSAAKHNAVVQLAQQNTLNSGPGVRQRRTPFGTTISFQSGDGGSSSPRAFRATIARQRGAYALRFEKGLLGGVWPVIGTEKIGLKGEDNRLPAVVITPEDFNDEGVCGVYFRAELNKGFGITRIEPVVRAAKPAKEPWVAYKLAGFVLLEGSTARYDRQLFSNLGFYPANRRANGFCDPLWFWSS